MQAMDLKTVALFFGFTLWPIVPLCIIRLLVNSWQLNFALLLKTSAAFAILSIVLGCAVVGYIGFAFGKDAVFEYIQSKGLYLLIYGNWFFGTWCTYAAVVAFKHDGRIRTDK
jgi:hypothetical protein